METKNHPAQAAQVALDVANTSAQNARFTENAHKAEVYARIADAQARIDLATQAEITNLLAVSNLTSMPPAVRAVAAARIVTILQLG